MKFTRLNRVPHRRSMPCQWPPSTAPPSSRQTRPSPPFPTPSRRSQQSPEAEAVEVVAAPETEVAGAVVAEVGEEVAPSPSIPGQSIQIFHLGSGRGARCTSAGAGLLIFVMNPQRVHGRMFTPASLPNNEKSTSSSKVTKSALI